MMTRDACLQVLARHRTDEIVVAVYKAAQEWLHLSPSDLNYTFTGAMRQGSSHALGLALGRPDKRVIVLDGDGSLLMNLGTLVTIATAAPKNFVHCLCQNGTYETNGAVSIPGRGKVSFTGLACEAGYPKTFAFDKLDDWERAVGRLLQEEGPIFVDLHVEPGGAYPEVSAACTMSSTASAFAEPWPGREAFIIKTYHSNGSFPHKASAYETGSGPLQILVSTGDHGGLLGVYG